MKNACWPGNISRRWQLHGLRLLKPAFQPDEAAPQPAAAQKIMPSRVGDRLGSEKVYHLLKISVDFSQSAC